MVNLEASLIRLRAVEPEDIDCMYLWENDPQTWSVSGTSEPFSRHLLARFVDHQHTDIFESRQQRLIIETTAQRQPIGTIDLFDLDPIQRRAGVGILIHDPENRGKGYASQAVELLSGYAKQTLRLHQLWCSVAANNPKSEALFLNAGFLKSGLRRDWHWIEDQYVDEIFMQKIL